MLSGFLVFTAPALESVHELQLFCLLQAIKIFGFQLFIIISSDIFSVESVVMCSPYLYLSYLTLLSVSYLA
jgi:hypothetical protein